jgi:hypothetical protein
MMMEYLFIVMEEGAVAPRWFTDVKNAILYSQNRSCKLERLHFLSDGTLNRLVIMDSSSTPNHALSAGASCPS